MAVALTGRRRTRRVCAGGAAEPRCRAQPGPESPRRPASSPPTMPSWTPAETLGTPSFNPNSITTIASREWMTTINVDAVGIGQLSPSCQRGQLSQTLFQAVIGCNAKPPRGGFYVRFTGEPPREVTA